MNIAEVLQQQATVRPDAVAIRDSPGGRERATTFADLERQSAQAANLLAASGLRAGDAVLIFQPMSAELYVALIACFRLGLVAMFLDPSAGLAHMERCCALHAPAALVAGTKAHLLRLVSPALRRIPRKFVIGFPVPGAASWRAALRQPETAAIAAASDGTPALLTFTSGSTGQPKAALRTHGFLLAQHRVLARTLSLQPGVVDLATLPVFVLANLASGVTSVIPNADLRFPGRIDPAPVVDQIERHQVQTIAASPALLERLVEHGERRGRPLTGLAKVFTGGAPVFPALLGRLQAISPRAEVVAVYGSTEAEPIAEVAYGDIAPEDHAAMHGGGGLLAGPVVDEIGLRLLPSRWGEAIGPFTVAQFDALCLPAEGVGEIVVSGDHVLPGYLHGHGDEETKFRVDGRVWHRTGDLGRLDERGRLWLLGRASARVEDGRGVLYPFAVECVVSTVPGVRRSAVLGIDGRRLLAVEWRKGEDHRAAELERAVRTFHIDTVREMPIPVDARHNAKVDYVALRKRLRRVAG